MNELPADISSTLMSAAADLMEVEGVTVGEVEPKLPPARRPARQSFWGGGGGAAAVPSDIPLPRNTVRLRGRLLVPPDQAYSRLAERLRPAGLTPLMRRGDDDGETVLAALPGTIKPVRPNVGLAAGLFALTALSCLFIGAQMTEQAANSGQTNLNLLDGLPYAGCLLAILLAHEFGHYITARRLGAPVSLPYFIPLPLPPLGTLGAVINMPAPPRDRRQLMAIGAAGPLCGLVVALPILWYGLHLSAVQPLPSGPYSLEGNSLLYALMKYLEFGRWLPGGGYDVFIGQVAMAGWAGLLVTGLNLIPAGQVDGGHILYALAGQKWAGRILWVVLLALAALSFLWLGWLLWVVLIFLVSRLRLPLLDDVTGLTARQRVLAVVMVLVFLLVFTPIPWTIIS